MFEQRSVQTELLDEENIPSHLLFRNLFELEKINIYLGGFKVSLAGMAMLIKDKNKTYVIADIGCGGGDSLKQLAIWGRKKGYRLQLIGIDIKEDCITYARDNCKDFPEITFIRDDYRNVFSSATHIDIVHASLFCHHLSDGQIVDFLLECKQAGLALVVNDLQRHWFAYYSIKILTRLFSSSPLVKNDAPISVLRGFKTNDWLQTLQWAGIHSYQLKLKWAFRYLLIISNERNADI